MQVDVMKTYRIALTPEEFSTLGKALAASEDPKAHELNISIQRLCHKQETLALEARTHCLHSAENGATK